MAGGQRGRRFVLKLKAQQVVIAPGSQMQEASHHAKKLGRLADCGARFANRLVLRHQLAQPSQQMPVPNAARALLDVRLQVENGVVKLRMTSARHLGQPLHQRVAVTVVKIDQPDPQFAEQCLIAAQKSEIQQADVHLDVLVVKLHAIGNRPNRMTHAQRLVPKHLQETGEWVLQRRQI